MTHSLYSLDTFTQSRRKTGKFPNGKHINLKISEAETKVC